MSCSIAPTHPNISALYRVPTLETQLPLLPAKSMHPTGQPLPAEVQSLFERLYAIDPAISMEVGMLPEFQGKVGERQILSLNRFVDMISKVSPEEKSKLDMLLKEGQPKVRRYCTPLQVIFWLLEKETYLKPNPLHYSLNDILRNAWDFTEENRWSDFEIVTDRLNSPELINYYERANFRYVSHGECSGSFKGIFQLQKGCCSDYTAFSEYCLRKAGYNAYAIQVKSPTGKKYHVVCEYEDKNGKKYIMDVDCYPCTGGRGILEKEEYTKKLPQIGFGYR
jgi:hypothetical protein